MNNAIFVLLLAAAVAAMAVSWFRDADHPLKEDAWLRAGDFDKGLVSRALLAGARPIAQIPAVSSRAASPRYQSLEALVLAAGGRRYGGDVEVFLAVQLLTIVAGLVVFVAGVTQGLALMPLVVLLAWSAAVAFYPYLQLKSEAKRRRQQILTTLPEFANVLTMALAGGQSVVQALRFTSTEVSGPVSDAVQEMLLALDSKSMSDREAFRLAGMRLGAVEAQEFFGTLAAAHIDGQKAVDTLRVQTDSLRKVGYQEARARLKTLSTKGIVITAAFFVPPLIIIVAIPTIVSFGGAA